MNVVREIPFVVILSVYLKGRVPAICKAEINKCVYVVHPFCINVDASVTVSPISAIICTFSISTTFQDTVQHAVKRMVVTIFQLLHAEICTTDFNLGKVAEAEKIDILNVNELALALQDSYKKGQKFTIKITEKGSNRGQGVGHLDDGSMVVVDKASTKIGETVEVEVLRFVQNAAGRIVFTKLAKN